MQELNIPMAITTNPIVRIVPLLKEAGKLKFSTAPAAKKSATPININNIQLNLIRRLNSV